MSRNLLLASALLVLTSSMTFLSAEDDKANESQAGNKASAHHMHNPDQLMASCVAVGNQEEIAVAEFARQKTQNEDVKKFVEMMITDHHTYLLKLRKFAPEATEPGYIPSTTKAAAKAGGLKAVIQQTGAAVAAAVSDDAKDDAKKVENADAKEAADSKESADSGKHSKFAQMERELAAECLALTKAKLGEKSGAEFDQCFIGQQIGAHMAMKAKLTVFQRHASPELAKVFAEGLKTTEHHLAKAEDLAKELHTTTTTIEKTREGKNRERKVIKEKEEK